MSNEKICNVKFCQLIRVASILYAPAILINARNSFRLLRNVMFWWAVVFWEKSRLILHRAFTSTHISPNPFSNSIYDPPLFLGQTKRRSYQNLLLKKSIHTQESESRCIYSLTSQNCLTATVPPYCFMQYNPLFSTQQSVATP